MSGLKLTDVIKTVRWNEPPVLTDNASTARQSNVQRGHPRVADPRGASTTGDDTATNGGVKAATTAVRSDRLKNAFLADLPAFTGGQSIAQTIAGADRRLATAKRGESEGATAVIPYFKQKNQWDLAKPNGDYERCRQLVGVNKTSSHHGSSSGLSGAERVVRSHLRYLHDFEPFRNGQFSQSTLYEFIFYMIVEKGRRESYTKRVIKTIMAYLKAGGDSVLGNLSVDSKTYIDNFKGMGGVKFSTFYRRMDSITNSLGDDPTKRLLSAARLKRPLVFNDDEEARILRHCVNVLHECVDKYLTGSTNPTGGAKRLWRAPGGLPTLLDAMSADVTRDKRIHITAEVSAVDTTPGRTSYERTIFEFSFAYVLGFLSGARIKSTVLKFSLDDVKALLAGRRLEVLTKGVFVNVFLPESVLKAEAHLYGRIITLRTRGSLYSQESPPVIGDDDEESSDSDLETDDVFTRTDKRFFTRSARQLELMLDRVYKILFDNKARAKGVRWHSQRRRYLGVVHSKYGTKTASESVGHRDLSTTMTYINNSLHMEDVRSRAGDAISERYNTIVSQYR